MGNPFEVRADQILDREQIRECVYRYARGIDRCDEELLRSAYWPDATAHQLEFSGTRDEFVAWTIPALESMNGTQHLVGNVLIQLDGPVAAVESYFYGFHSINVDGAARDTVMSGRYVDRFERREGEWRIAERTVVVDWFREYPDSTDWARGPFGMRAVAGSRKPEDSSYGLFRPFVDG